MPACLITMDQGVAVKKTVALITDLPTDCLIHILERLLISNVCRERGLAVNNAVVTDKSTLAA